MFQYDIDHVPISHRSCSNMTKIMFQYDIDHVSISHRSCSNMTKSRFQYDKNHVVTQMRIGRPDGNAIVLFDEGWEFAHWFSQRKNERMSDLLKKTSDSLIRSFLVSDLSDFSRSLISSEQPEQIAHGCSFLVSHLSNSLTSLIFGKWPEHFTHISHQKRGNEWFAHF